MLSKLLELEFFLSNILMRGLWCMCPECHNYPHTPRPGLWVKCKRCGDSGRVPYNDPIWGAALDELYIKTNVSKQERQDALLKSVERYLEKKEEKYNG